MSAQPIMTETETETETTTRHLRVVDNNVEKMGLLLSTRQKGRDAYAFIRRSPRVAWDWIRKTFHLDPAIEFMASVLTWLRNQISILAAHFGTTGGMGLGLLAVSTTLGRELLAWTLKPAVWLLSMAGSLWRKIESGLVVTKPTTGFHRVRNWLALRMTNIREFFFGNGDDKAGVLGAVAGWFVDTIAPHLHMNSTAMVAARAAGFAMAGGRAVAALALVPMSAGALAAAQWVMGAIVVISVGANVIELGRRIWDTSSAKMSKPAAQATENAEAVAEKVSVLPDAEEAAMLADGNRPTRRASTPRKGSNRGRVASAKA
jgi:hypothetical protein